MGEAVNQFKDLDDPDLSNVVTEDDEPVDNLYSERQQHLLVDSLYASGEEYQAFVALANVGLFALNESNPYVPDVLVSLGVVAPEEPWAKRNRSYFIWRYGKPPDLVIEVVSNKSRHEEEKLEGYARLGIRYYAISDPMRRLSQRKLRVYELQDSRYIPVIEPKSLTSLPFGLCLEKGTYAGVEAEWLRFINDRGEVLQTGLQRAEAEKQHADGEKQRADLLAQKLRELGIDPTTLG